MRSFRKVAILTCTTLLAGLVVAIAAQEKPRTVDEQNPRFAYNNPPVSIVSRQYKGRPFSKGDQFNGDKEWLSSVTFDVKNTSSKPIVYLFIDISIDGNGRLSKGSEVGLPISFGDPLAPFGTDRKKDAMRSIKPGEIIQLAVKTQSITGAKKALAQNGIDDFDKITVDIRYIHFEDGTGWSMGFETRQDSDDPSRWRVFNPNKQSSVLRAKSWIENIFASFRTPNAPLILTNLGSAGSRLFFISNKGYTASPPVSCKFFLETTFPACRPPNDGSTCDPPLDPVCKKPRDETSDIDEAETNTPGTIYNPPGNWCEPRNAQDEPVTNTGQCASCNPTTHTKWERGCGGGCNEQPDPINYPPNGCVYPYENVGGTCKRTSATCPTGVDATGCNCLPTPSPTPTPPPSACPFNIPGTPPNVFFPYCNFGYYYNSSTGYCCPSGCMVGQHSGCLNCEGQMEACSQSVTGFWDEDVCECQGVSPIVVDISGNGFNLTNAANGVTFDFNGDGIQDHISWTSAYSDDAWLVLDWNQNGFIDNSSEMFGNFTPQPIPPFGEVRNGFLALAEYDKLENGGNGDGSITKRDMIFRDLRLWQDTNHNGISESTELATLPQVGLRKMDLDYHESQRTDEFGNKFKFRAKVKDAQGAQLGRWAWDVFLVRQP